MTQSFVTEETIYTHTVRVSPADLRAMLTHAGHKVPHDTQMIARVVSHDFGEMSLEFEEITITWTTRSAVETKPDGE